MSECSAEDDMFIFGGEIIIECILNSHGPFSPIFQTWLR